MSSFYESEFEENLLKLIRKNYGLANNEIIYMIIRYMIVFNVKKVNLVPFDLFCEFLKEDNNLPNEIIFKGSLLDNSSLRNIIANWFLDLYKDTKIYFNFSFIENVVENIFKNSNSLNSKLKKESFYREAVTYSSLLQLNNEFGVKFESFFRMDDLYYDVYHNDLERFREEKLEGVLQSYEKFKANPLSLISEHDLEDFLKKNLSLIEDGLTFIEAEYKIKDGVIDILAEDKNNIKTILELKIKSNDTRVIWQSIYYPLQLKKDLNIDEVRMIIVSPPLDESILMALKTINNIEYFKYSLEVKNKNITNLVLEKVL